VLHRRTKFKVPQKGDAEADQRVSPSRGGGVGGARNELGKRTKPAAIMMFDAAGDHSTGMFDI
jgi:hypothetical protein